MKKFLVTALLTATVASGTAQVKIFSWFYHLIVYHSFCKNTYSGHRKRGNHSFNGKYSSHNFNECR